MRILPNCNEFFTFLFQFSKLTFILTEMEQGLLFLTSSFRNKKSSEGIDGFVIEHHFRFSTDTMEIITYLPCQFSHSRY